MLLTIFVTLFALGLHTRRDCNLGDLRNLVFFWSFLTQKFPDHRALCMLTHTEAMESAYNRMVLKAAEGTIWWSLKVFRAVRVAPPRHLENMARVPFKACQESLASSLGVRAFPLHPPREIRARTYPELSSLIRLFSSVCSICSQRQPSGLIFSLPLVII